MTAQMDDPAAAARAREEILAYWTSRRDGSRLPSRASIHPTHFKALLPTVSLIDVAHDPRGYRVRLAGTGLYGIYGREITGLGLNEIHSAAAADYWRAELDAIVERRTPGTGVHSFVWRGGYRSILWLRLPLASNGTDVDMILGYDELVGSQGARGVGMASGIRAA